MDITLGGLAFFCLIAAHVLAVVAVHNPRWAGDAPERQDQPDGVHARYALHFGG